MPNASAMTSPPVQPGAPQEPAWFIQAAGQVWGPYRASRIVRFVAEGRVTSQSLVAADVDGPFHPAGRWRSLAPLFQTPKLYRHQPAPIVSAEPSPEPSPQPAATRPSEPPTPPNAAPKLEPEPTPASPSSAIPTPLLIWAELTSLDADQFHALVARYGVAMAIRPALWLVQAQCGAAALRNALSRHLTGADAMMVVHAPLDQAAWFNLDSAAERRLRQVWGGAA